MPHIIIEHSAKGTSANELQALTHALFTHFAAHDLIPNPETLKIRTIGAAHLHFGSGHDSFAHAHLYILKGRSDDDKKELCILASRIMAAGLPEVEHFSADCIELSPGYHKFSRS